MAILITVLLGAAIIALVLLSPLWRRYKRKQLMAKPFPAAWRDILKRRLPYFRALPADLQLQLKKHIQVFVAEKQFIGSL